MSTGLSQGRQAILSLLNKESKGPELLKQRLDQGE